MANTDLEYRAQQLAYDAMEERDPVAREALAKRALMVFPDCADAYNILAGMCENLTERLSLYETAESKARPALGEFFQDHRGEFWMIHETRPFMRALGGRAATLYELGRLREAAAAFDELERLDREDRIGARYGLAKCLILLDDQPVDKVNFFLYGHLGEETVGAFFQAFYLFRRLGDVASAKRALTIARRANRFVVPLLLEKKATRGKLVADEARWAEAEWIAEQLMSVCRSIPGALAWLQSELVRKPNARSRK